MIGLSSSSITDTFIRKDKDRIQLGTNYLWLKDLVEKDRLHFDEEFVKLRKGTMKDDAIMNFGKRKNKAILDMKRKLEIQYCRNNNYIYQNDIWIHYREYFRDKFYDEVQKKVYSNHGYIFDEKSDKWIRKEEKNSLKYKFKNLFK
ncbi:MAG: hypothetical protein U9O87_08410 [Verrucomicrobiota bacterium]|nr:hypothetical protein [Verrucomicrobiota bacterium]